MKIVILVPNVLRDLHGLTLVAAALVQRGFTCYLVPIQRWVEVFALAPDAILLHQLRTTQDEFVRRFLACRIDVFVLDVEGMERLAKYRKMNTEQADIKQQVRRFMAWGAVIGDYLRSDGGYAADQVVLTGSPRHDFYAPHWRAASLAVNQEAAAITTTTPMILINTNTPYANHPNARLGIDAAAQEGAELGMTDDLHIEKERQTSAMHGMIEATNALTAHFPNVTFVLRPHPFEDLDTYRRVLIERDNLRIIRQGSVDGWILRAAAVVQRSCSTAVESALSGVPSLSPHWFSAMDYALPDSLSIQTHSVDELFDRVEQALAGDQSLLEPVKPTLDAAIHDWLYKLDGLAHVRVVDTVCAGLSGRGVDVGACARALYRVGQPVQGLRKQIERRARYQLRLSPETETQIEKRAMTPDKTARFFDVAMVQRWLDAIAGIDSTYRAHAHTITRRDLIAPMTSFSVVVSSAPTE